jgi:hypothetical protein
MIKDNEKDIGDDDDNHDCEKDSPGMNDDSWEFDKTNSEDTKDDVVLVTDNDNNINVELENLVDGTEIEVSYSDEVFKEQFITTVPIFNNLEDLGSAKRCTKVRLKTN